MRDTLTMANVNMYAVLRNLEDLCSLDPEMNALIQNKNLTLQLSVKNGPNAAFKFENGTCTFLRGTHPSHVKLYLTSPDHFNKMVDGKANPIPVKGLTKIGFLTNEFSKLTDKLGHYLKPTDALMACPDYRKINITLTAYTAFHALAEIGNHDPVGQMCGKRIADGNISVSINDGPALYLNAAGGTLSAYKGHPEKVHAKMVFSDLDSAGHLLHGKVDSYTSIANKSLELKGYIPMIDNMNKILAKVPHYL